MCYWVELHPRLDSEAPRLLRAWTASPGLSGGINAYLTPPGAECKTTSFPFGCFPEGVYTNLPCTNWIWSFPSSGAVGKPPHIDDHDVVVLHLGWEHDMSWDILLCAALPRQLAGCKCWTLLEDSRAATRASVTLQCNDVMYLPQGQGFFGFRA